MNAVRPSCQNLADHLTAVRNGNGPTAGIVDGHVWIDAQQLIDRDRSRRFVLDSQRHAARIGNRDKTAQRTYIEIAKAILGPQFL